jgi:nucleoside-diphosphate-sugar epimerase
MFIKGGGHGSIGLHLCKALSKTHPHLDITVLQDKCKRETLPFSRYNELSAIGVTVIEEKLTSPNAEVIDSLQASSFDYVVDNWSKNEVNSTFVVSKLAQKDACKQLIFVSSAGMYTTTGAQPIIETDAVKSSNDARKIENTVIASGIPYTFLRPQYIYGKVLNHK